MHTATVSSSAEPAARGEFAARLRLSGVLLWLGCGTVVTALGGLLLAPFPRLAARWRRAMFRRLSRGTARLVGLRIEVRGEIPPAPFLLVSNHLSYLDIVAYASVGPARFIAKREVRGWPGLGLLAHSLGTLFIDREQKRDALRVLDQMTNALREGDGMILFAESTSSPGDQVLPFRPALLDWAARESYPVRAASISYRVPAEAPPASRSVCWWGDMPFAPHLLGLCRLGRIDAIITYCPVTIVDSDRKLLAARLHAAVVDAFTPTGIRQA